MSLIGKKLLNLFGKTSKRDSSVAIPSYEQAKRIAVLYTFEDEKKEEAVDALKELIDVTKKVDILCFIDKKEIPYGKHPSFRIEQLSNWGKINSEEVEKFLETPYDYLIHLDFEMNEIIKNLLTNTKAKCRVGFHADSASSYYELMIGMNKSAGTTNFAQQIVKYIKAIR